MPYRFLLNLNSHNYVLACSGQYYVKYTISLLDARHNHQNTALRQIAMTDPSERPGNLTVESEPCLQEYNLHSEEMPKIYSDRDRYHVAVITMGQEYLELQHTSV